MYNKPYKGILTGLKVRMHKNRLGELLVLNGFMSPSELYYALAASKRSGQQLGAFLVEQNIVERDVIRSTLTQQFMLRLMTAAVAVIVSFASFGMTAKTARAQSIKDVPARMAFQDAAYSSIAYHPRIFGSQEKQSRSLSAFTKWTSMFSRFDIALNSASGQKEMQDFKTQIEFLRGMPLDQMAEGVNAIVNRVRYINDSNLYGKTDYWATPIEFLKNGGDCEDYAITKYTALRMLGVPENRMRILVLQDLQKNIPHAILVVYTEKGPLLLDNQIKTAIAADKVSHYKPIFSINRESWWLHTKPTNSMPVMATASR